MKRLYFVYKITNRVNGKIYIGQHSTVNLNDGYMGSGKIILRAIKRYGKENFSKEILCFCNDLDHLNQMEKEYVDASFVARKDTYNLREGGANNEITREKISASLSGRKLSVQHIERIRGSKLNKKHSLETRSKMSLAARGRKMTPEQIEKNRIAHMGIKHTEESKRKMSIAQKAKFTAEIRAKISQARSRIIPTITNTQTGEIVSGFSNATRFCAERGISRFKFNQLLKGKITSVNNWILVN